VAFITFYIYNTWQINKSSFDIPYPTFVPHLQWIQSSENIHVCNVGTIWKNYFPCSSSQRSIFRRSTSATPEVNAHEDWTIGWSAKGPYSQPLAIWP
jgi:hypothetical protein